MDDEAILAGLDSEPDAFAVFYRRHVAALLDHFFDSTHDLGQTAELRAETFAAALDRAQRFDRERDTAEAWLFGIAHEVLAQTQYRGAVEQRARRRLGIAALGLAGDPELARFVRELEEELVLAAQFRASRRANRPRVTLPPKSALIGVAAVVLAAVVALALTAGGDERRAVQPRATATAGDERRADEPRAATAGGDSCSREVAPALLTRVAALHAEPPDRGEVPGVVLEALAGYQLEAIAEDGARFWGRDGGVEFWVVPVVPRGTDCAPASAACVVAVTPDARANAECVLDAERRADAWRLAPLLPGHAAIYGIVPDGVTGARVTIGDQAARVDARQNVLAGVLPFPYRDAARNRVELVRRPAGATPVGVVDAGGSRRVAENVRARIRQAGYRTPGSITPGVKPQPGTDVYWWPDATLRRAALRIAHLIRADTLRRIELDTAPRPVLATRAPVVVVVGSGH